MAKPSSELADFPLLAQLVGKPTAELTQELDGLTAVARSRGPKTQRATAEAVALIQETHRAQQAR